MDNYKRLIVRFLEEGLDGPDADLLKDWLKESEKNRKLFDQYNEIWQMSPSMFNSGNYDLDKKWAELNARIKKELPSRKEKSILVNPAKYLFFRMASAAALFTGILLISFYLINNQKKEIRIVRIQAPQGEKSKIMLADGTNVWLNSGSELSWQSDFGDDQRMVTLTGEGYFDVNKSTEPFIVKAENAEIKVFGTKFNISSYADDENVEATLEEGSITVNAPGVKVATSVKPGQRAVINKENGKISLSNVNTDLYTSWKENKLKFDNAPFGDVVKKLERWYDVKIILDSRLRYSERYTMTIKTESLREVLARIQITTPMKYKIEEEKVFIYPKKMN